MTEDALADQLAHEPVAPGAGAMTIVTANLAHIVELRTNADFRAAYRNAWMQTVDGTPVFLYARARGIPLPGRLTGSGAFAKLLGRLRPSEHRCYFVAPSQEVAAQCAERLVARGFEPGSIGWDVPPKGFEANPQYGAALAERIRAHAPTHLFFGVGAPKSEIWAETYRRDLGDCYVMCVGAGLEFYTGAKSRGPEWMRRIGFEWLWRLASEPRRLARRYLVSSWGFLAAVLADLAGRPLIESGRDPNADPNAETKVEAPNLAGTLASS